MIIKRDCICTPYNSNRPLHIYLPDNYYDTDERYPVMYFFDGHNLYRDEDATYGKCWGLESFMHAWDKAMILVGIECGHEGRERLDEYSPYSWDNEYIGKVNGKGEKTLDWIVEELKPAIDAEFRTYSHREATAIGGSSMGGLMSLYGAVKYNDCFSKAACLSTTIIPCIKELGSDIRRALLNEDTRIWLSYGTDEAFGRTKDARDLFLTATARCTDDLIWMLNEKNVITRVYVQQNGRHCEADWEKQVPGFMDFLWK